MSNNDNISYYIRKSGVVVRLINGVILEYLNPECKWIPNQEWYMSMFVDGEEELQRISKNQVETIINAKLNSSQININEDQNIQRQDKSCYFFYK